MCSEKEDMFEFEQTEDGLVLCDRCMDDYNDEG